MLVLRGNPGDSYKQRICSKAKNPKALVFEVEAELEFQG